MKTITITFEDNTVIVTDGRHTETSNFNKITYEPKQALIALAEFYGYEPAGLLCFDEGFEDEEEEYDDDNDFLQGLMDDAETQEFIECWLNQLLEATGKANLDELTCDEVRAEIYDIKGTISNEEIVLGISEFAEKNIEHYKAYLEVLEEMLKNKEEINLNKLTTHEDIIEAFNKLKEKAVELGTPICLNTTTSTELELYYHEDYPNRILVDKYESDRIRKCPKCGKDLAPSDVAGYAYTCYHCDENFYHIEVDESDNIHADIDLEKAELLECDMNTGKIKVDKQIFDDFVPNTYINIKFVDTDSEEVLQYVMTSEDDDGIYMEQLVG